MLSPQKFLLQLSCLLSLLGCLALALPSPGVGNNVGFLEARAGPTVPAYALADVTVEKLLSVMCTKPGAGQCLFYTAKQTTVAAQFARTQPNSIGVTMTIWDAFPSEWYDESDDPSNALRDIMRLPKPADQMTQAEYQATAKYEYFKRMSEALAMSCSGTAYVMTPDINSIPEDGIWGQTEKTTLIKGNPPSCVVDTIIAVNSPTDPNDMTTGATSQKVDWSKSTSKRARDAESVSVFPAFTTDRTLDKRDVCGFQGLPTVWDGAIYY